jgi:hypothetical protein
MVMVAIPVIALVPLTGLRTLEGDCRSSAAMQKKRDQPRT